MARVKGGVQTNKRRKNILKMVKGYRFGRSTKKRQAKEAIAHAGTHAFRDRRLKKRSMRQLWTIKINAALRPLGLSYSKTIDSLKKKNIELDRKVLAEIAENYPSTFNRIIETKNK
jgi:large subunit ribosomal protein L20